MAQADSRCYSFGFGITGRPVVLPVDPRRVQCGDRVGTTPTASCALLHLAEEPLVALRRDVPDPSERQRPACRGVLRAHASLHKEGNRNEKQTRSISDGTMCEKTHRYR